MNFQYLTILIFLLYLFSCRSVRNTNENIKTLNINDNKINISSIITNSNDTNIYRYTISFFSRGSGIDYKVKSKYDSFIKEFEKKKGLTLKYEIIKWGKEGETDYCFHLFELSIDDQEKFINGSKNILKESKDVRINENTICRNKKK